MKRRFLLLLACLCACPSGLLCGADDGDVLQTMLQIQSRVQAVVAANMECCVSISDGVGYGSGVVVSEDGLILTAGHVMSDSKEYEIIFPSGRTARARPLGKNLNVDAGMLQIVDQGPWPAAKLATQPIAKGDWTVSLGHSGGFELGRKPPVRTGRYLRQRGSQLVTDAVLIGGDSGGPLFNLDGEVIAIHSSIGDSIAENRHVEIAAFHRDWDRLKRGDTWGQLPELGKPDKSVNRARIGVTVDRKANDARVIRVRPGSPAAIVGIRADDVVTEFDGEKITSSIQLIERIKRKMPGDVCTISVKRRGIIHRFLINLAR